MAKYRVCVIGCSPGRGRDHVRAFVHNADRFEIAGLCDLNQERRAALGTEFGLDRLYSDADVMLAEQKPDVLCFVTPPKIRLDLIELALRHNTKVIAYEKPMAENWLEARAIHAAVTEADARTIVSHQHLYGAHWQKARELIAGGAIGDIQSVFAASKGWLLHYATHLMAYSMYLVGEHRIPWVLGHMHGRGKIEDDHPSPDHFLARYAFENGVMGQLECGTMSPSWPGENSFWLDAGATVVGTEGYVQVIVGKGVRARLEGSSELYTLDATFSPDHDQPLYVRDLADWLDDPAKAHPCDGTVAFRGFEVIMGACVSALDHIRVDLPLDDDIDVLGRMRDELPDCELRPESEGRP